MLQEPCDSEGRRSHVTCEVRSHVASSQGGIGEQGTYRPLRFLVWWNGADTELVNFPSSNSLAGRITVKRALLRRKKKDIELWGISFERKHLSAKVAQKRDATFFVCRTLTMLNRCQLTQPPFFCSLFYCILSYNRHTANKKKVVRPPSCWSPAWPGELLVTYFIDISSSAVRVCICSFFLWTWGSLGLQRLEHCLGSFAKKRVYKYWNFLKSKNEW